MIASDLNIDFLSPDRLSGRNDVTSDKVNFRLDIRLNFFFKKQVHQEFVWLLKEFVAPDLYLDKYQT